MHLWKSYLRRPQLHKNAAKVWPEQERAHAVSPTLLLLLRQCPVLRYCLSHQPPASDQQRKANPRRLFLQRAVHAIAGTAQQISMVFSQHSAWPGGMRGAIKSAASAKDAWRF